MENNKIIINSSSSSECDCECNSCECTSNTVLNDLRTLDLDSTSQTIEKDDPSILVSRLLQEVQQLRKDNRKLASQIEVERSARTELETAKNALTAEIEELTRNLFEEANGMVAIEAQARWTLQQAQERLETELHKTHELLELERDQNKMLKSIVEEEKADRKCNDPVMWDVDVFGARLTGSYYEDFFPERSFDSRTKESVSNWESLSSKTISSPQFIQFSSFIDECFKVGHKSNALNLSDDAILSILGHSFMRNCLHSDIEPCLAFPVLEKSGKLKSLLKKLLPAMLKNTCTIEPLPCTAGTGPLQSPESIRASPLSIRSFISITPPSLLHRSKTSSPISISKLTSSPPSNNSYIDSFFGSSPASITSIESCPTSPLSKTPTTSQVSVPVKCSLCDASGTTHKFRISPTASSTPVCKQCRDRLVSVATLFTTLRHLLQGLHAHRPKLDVYFDFLQAKRYMFYTRVGVDQSFYALSDFEAFSKKICE